MTLTLSPARFGELAIHPDILRAISDLGFVAPTPVQERAIPVLQQGRDLFAQAQTGTGKTAAFAIPILERVDAALKRPQALVVVPTRELALQVTREFGAIGRYRHAREAAIYGGVPYGPQERALKRGSTIVVGTPGRLLDHIERGTLDLSGVGIVILDEADRLLDMGFAPEVRRLLRKLPERRQTGLFSATLTSEVRDLAYRFTQKPVEVSIEPEHPTIDTVEQVYIEVLEEDKVRALEELLRRYETDQVLVFRHTKRGVDKLLDALKRRGHDIDAIHGDMSQKEREHVMERFKDGSLHVLIATNVAARGLHIEDVSHVVNYDLPEDADVFTHRVGRTGRAGKTGVAVTFVGEWDFDEFDALRKKAGMPFRREILEIYDR
ncbi:MAG: DEAD/DEAH box helicase [Chloroflexi bacterium]|nr:MAG: DEAD/DEAH box helicase [Chloroflexota bacterium]TMG38699.1 MAG: DEAD/DEAH box helicase [Chloroflexota bacterium]